MTVYNKLKIAILAILASQHIHAITIDPVKIQSAPGELLYAEINFRQSDINAPLQASLANAEDLILMGVAHQPPGHLNFFTRRDSSGNGAITITSSRPVTDAELNIVLKITEGNASRLQHIKTPIKRAAPQVQAKASSNEKPLKPIMVVNEKDIALSLPVSTQYTTAAPKPMTSTISQPTGGIPLNISNSAPPMLASNIQSSAAVTQSAPASTVAFASPAPMPTTAKAQTGTGTTIPTESTNSLSAVAPKAATNSVSQDPLVQKYAEEMALKKAQTAQSTPAEKAPTPAAPIQRAKTTPTSGSEQTEYVVQTNETLWGIASRIATDQNRSISDVMKQIKASNEHAFIQGNSNRLRRGAALNLNVNNAPKAQAKVNAAELAKIPSTQSGKAKYRLNQAEMILVSENEQDSIQASANKNTEKNQTSDKLSLKIMTSREKTVKLQRNVTQLELALNQKDQRIQLLNARLAELEAKLKAQRAVKKPIQ